MITKETFQQCCIEIRPVVSDKRIKFSKQIYRENKPRPPLGAMFFDKS